MYVCETIGTELREIFSSIPEVYAYMYDFRLYTWKSMYVCKIVGTEVMTQFLSIP